MKPCRTSIAAIAFLAMVLLAGADAQTGFQVKSAAITTGGEPGSSPSFKVTPSIGSPVGGTGSSPSFTIEYDVSGGEESTPTGIIPRITPPGRLYTYLGNTFPNPFNPTTNIPYGIRERGHVTLRVYNVRGQLVRTLVNGVQNPSPEHRVTWDGRNNRGEQVASGVYFYRLTTKNFTQAKKMVLLK